MIQTKLYFDDINKGYDKKVYPKLVLNELKVMKSPTPIYTPLGT
jgi:hypothetical protein